MKEMKKKNKKIISTQEPKNTLIVPRKYYEEMAKKSEAVKKPKARKG